MGGEDGAPQQNMGRCILPYLHDINNLRWTLKTNMYCVYIVDDESCIEKEIGQICSNGIFHFWGKDMPHPWQGMYLHLYPRCEVCNKN